MHWERIKGVSDVDRHKMWKEYVTAELSHHHINDEFRVNPISYQHARGIPDPISKRGKRFLDKESALLEALTHRLGPRAEHLLTNKRSSSHHHNNSAMDDPRAVSCPPTLGQDANDHPSSEIVKGKKKAAVARQSLPPLAAADSRIDCAADGMPLGKHGGAAAPLESPRRGAPGAAAAGLKNMVPAALEVQSSSTSFALPPINPRGSQGPSPASSSGSSESFFLSSPRVSPFPNSDLKQTLTTIHHRPTDKYKFPLTTAQEFGWLCTPRQGETPEPLDTRFRFPLKSCEITKLAAAYQHLAANGGTLAKAQKWGK